MDYRIEYLKLFNKITDTIKVLERETALLKAAQVKAEAMILANEANEAKNSAEIERTGKAIKLFSGIVDNEQ